MSKALGISNSNAAVDQQSEKITEAIRTLLSALPRSEQTRVLRELNNALQPISVKQAGHVLTAIVRLLPERVEWRVNDLKKEVAAEGVAATPKEVYNAMAYLTRKGHVRRIGYGRYLVNGAELITSDDLGGEPAKYED